MSNTKSLPVSLPPGLKKELEVMSEEVTLSQNALVVLAINSLVANYKVKGSFIFVDLLNPEHRESKKK